MLRIRTVAAAVIVFGLATAGAAAQSAPGKPLPLLQITQPKAKPKHHVLARRIVKRAPARHIARRHTDRHVAAIAVPVAEPAQKAAPGGSIWPAADTAATGEISTYTPPPAHIATELVINAEPDEIVTGSQPGSQTIPQGGMTLAADHTTVPAPAEAAAPKPAVRALVVAPAAAQPDPVGSASWIAQVLAALGGAITAGIVAWFLIRSGPPREADDEWGEAESA